jgi:hypothetical protein
MKRVFSPAISRERRIQARELGDFRTLIGVSDMGRAVIEEIATLSSLALFLVMVAIWAQVIATL